MLPSMVRDMRLGHMVDVLEAGTLTTLLTDIPATFNPVSDDELISGVGVAVQSDGSFFFNAFNGSVPQIAENNVIDNDGKLYEIISVINHAGQGDRLQAFVRYIE